MTGGLASDEQMSAWARSYLVAIPKYLPARPAAQTAIVHRRRPLLYGAALGVGVLATFAGVRWGLRDAPTDAALPVASSGVAIHLAEPEPLVAALPSTAGTRVREEDRPVRKTRPSSAPSNAPAHVRDERSGGETSKEKCILDIGSEPAFAYVVIDGVKVGPTPIFGREVTPGMHRIQVWREGLGSKTFNLEMRPGDRITRVVKLP
jgi:hypothetical protein